MWLTDWSNRAGHYKFDEGQPTCFQCSFHIKQVASAPIISRQPDALLGKLYADATQHDREMFFIMRRMALKSFSGVFDRDFWTADIVRAAQVYPTVWYAGLALAAAYRGLHEVISAPDGNRQLEIYALLMYSKSMQSMIGIIGNGDLSHTDREAVLLSNALAIGFCCLRRDNISALDHMGKGLRVFASCNFGSWASTPLSQTLVVDARSLVSLFRRLELQYASSGRQGVRQPWNPETLALSAAPFTSTTEAYYEFLAVQTTISDDIHMFTDVGYKSSQPYNLYPDATHTYRLSFCLWEKRFCGLLQLQKLDASQLERALILQIWAAVVRIRLHCQTKDASSTDVLCGEHDFAFRHIAVLRERLFAVMIRNAGQTQLPSAPLLFSHSLSVCEPLMYSVWCYDGAVSRKIITFLRMSRRRDAVLHEESEVSTVADRVLFDESYAIEGLIGVARLSEGLFAYTMFLFSSWLTLNKKKEL